MRRKPLILALVGALAAITVALPVGLAMADDQPDTLVIGTIIPAVAGQNIGVTVGGVACAKAVIPSGTPNGITDATGALPVAAAQLRGGQSHADRERRRHQHAVCPPARELIHEKRTRLRVFVPQVAN